MKNPALALKQVAAVGLAAGVVASQRSQLATHDLKSVPTKTLPALAAPQAADD